MARNTSRQRYAEFEARRTAPAAGSARGEESKPSYARRYLAWLRPERRALATDYGSKVRISEERVDPAEVASIVAEAASARNGWKVILARCAPTTKRRSMLEVAREPIVSRERINV